MTSNNLQNHLKWLLETNPIPPVGAGLTASTRSRAVASRSHESVPRTTTRLPDPPNRQDKVSDSSVPTVSSAEVFLRPALPTPKESNAPPPRRRTSKESTEESSMARLASAPRSSRPSLMSNHQLPTSASTTATASTPLMSNYSAQLRQQSISTETQPQENILTPIIAATPSRPSSNRPNTSIQRTERPSQSRPTTQSYKVFSKQELGEPIDLTGDDNDSNSSHSIFDEPQRIWEEAPASRSGPIVKQGIKRKSDEARESVIGSTRKKVDKDKPPLPIPAPVGVENYDDFMDIDDFEDSIEDVLDKPPPPPYTRHPRASEVNGKIPRVKASIKTPREDPFSDDQRNSTEPMPRTETVGKRTLSRVTSINGVTVERDAPSVAHSSPSKSSQYSQGPQVALDSDGSVAQDSSFKPLKCSQSPLKTKNSSLKSQSPSRLSLPDRTTSQFHDSSQEEQVPQQQVIEDSEETDEDLSYSDEDVSAATVLSPKFKTSQSSPLKWQTSVHDNLKPGSPSKPRSEPNPTKNLIRQDSMPSPFQKDSPTKVTTSSQSNPSSSQRTPSSTLSELEKRLLAVLSEDPGTISKLRVELHKSLEENKALRRQFLEDGEPPPENLTVQIRSLQSIGKAADGLPDLKAKRESLVSKRKKIIAIIEQKYDEDEDPSKETAKNATLTADIRDIDNEILSVLKALRLPEWLQSHPSEVVTHVAASSEMLPRTLNNTIERSQQSRGQRNLSDIPPQNSFEHTQVVQQTQVSSSTISTSKSDSGPQRNFPYEPVNRRQAVVREPWDDIDEADFEEHEFYQPSPRIHNNTFASNENSRSARNGYPVSHYNEDVEDFGDFDDDEDMHELAEDFEHQQSFGGGNKYVASTMQAEPSGVAPVTDGDDMSPPTKAAPSHLMRHPWSNDVKNALKNRFRLHGFRQNQLDAINETLSGKDAFVLMPTGGGKSLCYQLPAIVQSGKTRGVTIVVSPLLSLMTDQVHHLRNANIQATLINGECTQERKRDIFSALEGPQPEQFIQLLYITPEMLNKSHNLLAVLDSLHRRNRLARFVIDEAHCISQWGHDFRQDYKALGNVRPRFPGVPIIALTATATPTVREDVLVNLNIKKGACKIFEQSFNRPNLTYEVRKKTNVAETFEEIVQLIKTKYRNQTGIIYALSKKNCEDLAEKLRGRGLDAKHFHAALDGETKKEIQQDWQAGKTKIIVATIAFGMGIDKPDVRFVIHHSVPKTLEGYYQETGRAGRDGKRSGCYLFYGYQDTGMLKKFITDSEGSPEQKERQREMLRRMVQFSQNETDCRRVELLEYFGEAFEKKDCNYTCDNCNSKSTMIIVDRTAVAQAAIKVVRELAADRQVTIIQCADILCGWKLKKNVVDCNNLPEYGMASDISRDDVEAIFRRLMAEDALKENNVANARGFIMRYVKVGPKWRDYMSGKSTMSLARVSSTENQMKPPQMNYLSSRTTAKQPIKRGTGVNSAKTNESYPPSTNISSPIRATTRLRKRPATPSDDEDFIVPDDTESEDDGFEPVRVAPTFGKRQAMMKVGPPITADQQLSGLNDVHRAIIPQFVHEAKKLEEEIRNQRSLRKPLFTELQLRAMAIAWHITPKEMKRIPGINQENVNLWGNKFTPLIQRYFKYYCDAMEGSPEFSHKIVVDLSSDEESDGDEVYEQPDNEYEDEDDGEISEEANEKSSYFQVDPKVAEFNKRMDGTPGFVSKGKGKAKARSPSQASTSAPSKFKKPARRSNGSASGGSGRRFSGVKKKAASGSTSTTGRRGSGPAATKKAAGIMERFGKNAGGGGESGGRKGGGGGSGIMMMPT